MNKFWRVNKLFTIEINCYKIVIAKVEKRLGINSINITI